MTTSRPRLARLASALPFAVLLGTSACAGKVVSIGNDEAASTSAGDGGTASNSGDDASVAPTLGTTPAACSQGSGVAATPASQTDVQLLVDGLWVLCGEPSVFGTSDEIGIEILSDGDWFKLYDTKGVATPGSGMGEEGTWQAAAVNGGSSFGFNLSVYGSGVVNTIATVSSSPQLLVLDNGGVRTTYAFYETF